MAYQLIYTSWPTSLVRGRSGFSTVARSAGMAERFGAVVERCCVYDSSVPLVWAHSKIEYGGVVWHVLSRICDAGVDYTNRNNYLAHHLAISEEEVATLNLNPVDVILGWKGWVSKWNEDPRLLDDVSDLSSIVPEISLPAKTWEGVFGDAACAALLEPNSPVSVNADADSAGILLRLFGESAALSIKRSDMWIPTFTTRFAFGDNPANFIWKGVNSGAPISLCPPKCPSPPPGRRSEYARTGAMTNLEKYNLKVGTPKKHKPDFKVVKVEAKPFPSGIVIGLGALVAIVAVAAIFLIFYSWGSERDFGAGREGMQKLSEMEDVVLTTPSVHSQVDSASLEGVSGKKSGLSNRRANSPEGSETVYELVERARECVAGNKFAKAIETLENSSYSGDEKLRESLLADIAHRIDYLLRYADNVLTLSAPGAEDLTRAISYISAARAGLETDPSLRTAGRMEKLKYLNEKAKDK